MSVRGVIMAKLPGGEMEELLPFVGRNPERALSDVIRKGYATARFVPHEPEGDDDVA